MHDGMAISFVDQSFALLTEESVWIFPNSIAETHIL